MLDLKNEDRADVGLQSERISVRSLVGLTQHMVSGNIEAFTEKYKIGPVVGLLGQAAGQRYAARMARDRILVVGVGEKVLVPGWNPEGYAVTPMSSALQVFELSGSGLMEIIARGCVLDPGDTGPCAAISFAGLTVSLYRHNSPDTVRLHADRSFAHYLSAWISANLKFVTR